MTWKTLPEQDPTPPQRPRKDDCGKRGTPIVLTTNYFPVEVQNKKLVLYHYDVAIKDYKGDEFTPPLPKSKNMIIFEKMKESFPKLFKGTPLSYDSVKNAYSTKMIPQFKKPVTYEVKLVDEEKKADKPEDKRRVNRSTFKVTMVKVNQASLGDLFESMKYVQGKSTELPTTIVQMIEVMFRHYRARKYEQIANRNFFSIEQEFAAHHPIGGGKIGVTGFFGSLRPAAWKDGSILLNLDMAHTAFYQEMNVLDFIKEMDLNIQFTGTLQDRYIKNLTKALKGLKIRVSHAVRTYKVYEVHRLGSDSTKFDLTNEKGTRNITVVDYFREQYRINLKYPHFNCLNVGNQNKQVFIPAELCRIDKGQKVRKKLSESEVATFIRSTAVAPAERLRQIRSVAEKNRFKEDEMLKAMTFTISDIPLQTKGRILPAPNLTMERATFTPNSGQWDVRNKRFHNAASLKSWAVINYDGNRTRSDTVRNFIQKLVTMGKSRGMQMEMPFDVYEFKERRDPNPLDDLKYYKDQRPDLQMVMCILPGRKYYGAIKKAGDTQVNIVTQCVLGQNVFKCQDQTIGNILLKINAKMDGINNIITTDARLGGFVQFKEAFLIMGADVNHPPAGGDSSIPSIAAVVGSYDRTATKYAVERRAQYHREEVIRDMKDITKNLIINYFRKTQDKPQRIIMFRDGVSESQFSIVLSQEMRAMREACQAIQKDGQYKPGITFICVQKRHHTRLFCDERYVQNQRNKNVPPGTVVDRDITHPTETDFYLCSHQGIQGTSKPTHYHLLWDDNDLPIDELQAMTYQLCHVYSRCARSVSIPTPVYYAHLAAFRAKVYVSEILGGGSETGSVVSGSSAGQEVERLRVEIVNTARVTTAEPLSTKLHYI